MSFQSVLLFLDLSEVPIFFFCYFMYLYFVVAFCNCWCLYIEMKLTFIR
jgi:hypothetical protein